MLSTSLQTFRHAELSQLSIPELSRLAKTTALGGLDLAGRVAQGIDAAIETVADTVSTSVPKGARFTTSLFPLPDKVDNVIVGTIDFITQGGMWLAKITATASVQAFLYGAPAWMQAARTGVAVYGTTAELQHGDTSAQFLARCLGEHSLPAKHRETFHGYIDLKKKLTASAESKPLSRSAAQALEQQLARYTVTLGNSIDLSLIDAALAGASAFTKQSPDTVKHTAEKMAASVLENIEGFYTKHAGRSAGTVSGTWASTKDSASRSARRKQVESDIATRLGSIFSADLSPHETAVKINKIAATLNSSFGTYRQGFIGLLGTTLGIAWHSGVLLSHAAVAWGYITGSVGYVVKVSTNAIRKGITSAVSWGKDKVKDSVDELTSDLKETIKEQVKTSLAQNTSSGDTGKASALGVASENSESKAATLAGENTCKSSFTSQIFVSADPVPPAPAQVNPTCRIA